MPNDVTLPTASATPAATPTVAPVTAPADPVTPAPTEADAKAAADTAAAAKVAADADAAKVAADTKAASDKAEADYVTRREKDNTDALQAAHTKWAEDARADTEIGGAQFEANLAVAQKGLEQFFPELKEHLDITGLGNHPAVIKGFMRIGKAISQDKFLPGGPTPTSNKQTTTVLYDNKA